MSVCVRAYARARACACVCVCVCMCVCERERERERIFFDADLFSYTNTQLSKLAHYTLQETQAISRKSMNHKFSKSHLKSN